MADRFHVHLNKGMHDLNPIGAGQANLVPGHTWGPKSVNYVIIHKITKGCGTLFVKGQTYHLQAGDAFIIMPGEVAKWVADETDPWSYEWVTFTGELSMEFGQLPPVFPAPEWMFAHLNHDAIDPDDNLEYMLAGDLFHLYGALLKPQKKRQDHIQRAVDYVQSNYMKELTIQMIADHVGLNRDYLARLFKQKTGSTLQAHILDVRCQQAQRYLYQGMSIKEAAMLSGFKDVSNFSKHYKRREGVSPKQWKKEICDPTSSRRSMK